MNRLGDHLKDPLIAEETRSLSDVLREDFGITHVADGHTAIDGRRRLTGNDGADFGRMRSLEAWRFVRDQRAAA